MPIEFSRNGTFMAYRKLHEDSGAFAAYLDEQAGLYASAFKVDKSEAKEVVTAKLVGRWSDGVPLMAAPTFAAWQTFNAELKKAHDDNDKPRLAQIALRFTNFNYRQDGAGSACPVTSHMRRANPRDMLDPHFSGDKSSWDGSALDQPAPDPAPRPSLWPLRSPAPPDQGDQGIIFLALCSSLFRQFEFVQQQWMQYGLDFNAGSDTCPVIGNHIAEKTRVPDGKMVIAADPADANGKPFICDRHAAIRRAARRRLFLHPEHDRAPDDRVGDRRSDLNSEHCAKRWVPAFRKKQCGNKGLQSIGQFS